MFVIDLILSAIWAVTMFVTILLNWQLILWTVVILTALYALLHLLARLVGHRL